MRFRGYPLSGRRGAQSLIGAVLIMTAAPGSAMTVMADAFPGSGPVVAAPVIDGAVGPAGEVGPVLAGGFHDPVAEAADPFGRAPPAAHRHPQAAAGPASPGHVPQRFEPLVMMATGIGFIIGVSLLRSRRRRRRGWGSLPDRAGIGSRLWG